MLRTQNKGNKNEEDRMRGTEREEESEKGKLGKSEESWNGFTARPRSCVEIESLKGFQILIALIRLAKAKVEKNQKSSIERNLNQG